MGNTSDLCNGWTTTPIGDLGQERGTGAEADGSPGRAVLAGAARGFPVLSITTRTALWLPQLTSASSRTSMSRHDALSAGVRQTGSRSVLAVAEMVWSRFTVSVP